MTWENFAYFAIPVIVCYILATYSIITKKKKLTDLFMIMGITIFGIFITGFWVTLNRPPMRTMGETRLWYSMFISMAGFISYKHWKYHWLLIFSALLSTVFICINLLKPEIHSIALMPALQSIYFIPHVIVYILAYSILGVATVASIIQLIKIYKDQVDMALYNFIDNLVYIGFGFLMLGLLSGAVWAKEAWGHYWSWDPKETWALITAAAYLAYIHMRLKGFNNKVTLIILPIAFMLLMMAWFGVSFLPAAKSSIHVYS